MRRPTIDKFFLGGIVVSVLVVVGSFLIPRAELRQAEEVSLDGRWQFTVAVSTLQQIIVYSADRAATCVDSAKSESAGGLTTPFLLQPRPLAGTTLHPLGEVNGYRAQVAHTVTCVSASPVYYATSTFVTETGLILTRVLAAACLALFGLLAANDLRT